MFVVYTQEFAYELRMNFVFCLLQITEYFDGLKFWGYVGHTFKKNENNDSRTTVDIKAVSSSNKHERPQWWWW